MNAFQRMSDDEYEIRRAEAMRARQMLQQQLGLEESRIDLEAAAREVKGARAKRAAAPAAPTRRSLRGQGRSPEGTPVERPDPVVRCVRCDDFRARLPPSGALRRDPKATCSLSECLSLMPSPRVRGTHSAE
jgi:hypothetical protein